MGNKESVMFIYMLNCVICVLFFIKGVLMWQASKPTLETAKFLQNNNYDVNQVPASLLQHTQIDSYLVQRAKFKYCFFLSIFTTALIFLSTFLRLTVTYDTYDKEEKILNNLQKMKEHYDSAASKDDITLD